MSDIERAVKYLVKDEKGNGHLPYTKDDGKPDHRLMGAAWAALHGGYRGNKYSGPGKADAIAKLTQLYKSEGMDTPKESKSADEGEIRTIFTPEGEFRVSKRDGKPSMITGYPAKFNSLSRDLGGFRENIKPGAFQRSLDEGADVRALQNHNPDLVLGRTKSGTLRLEEDPKGLHMEVDAPDTQHARDLMTSIDRGDVDQGSFRFKTRSDNWRMQDGQAIRDLYDVDLRDVSAVTFPAYDDSSVGVRSLSVVGGIEVARLEGILIRAEHELEVTSADRDFLRAAIERMKEFTTDTADPPPPALDHMRQRLALAERE